MTRRLALVGLLLLVGTAPLWGCQSSNQTRLGQARDRVDRSEGRSLGEVARPRRRVLGKARRGSF